MSSYVGVEVLTEHVSRLSITQSEGLAQRHKNLRDAGEHPTDDSKPNEKRLANAMRRTMEQIKDSIPPGFDMVHVKKISLYDCQLAFHRYGGPAPKPCEIEENKKVSMKPDGGIVFLKNRISGHLVPILISEDKHQGTNDKLHAKGKKRQATGNAIERFAKNMNMLKTLCKGLSYFPFVIFAAGCDFHKTETIRKRLEQGNMGISNHYVDVTPAGNFPEVSAIVDDIVVEKRFGGESIATICVKAHKYDTMNHHSSDWTEDEYFRVLTRVAECSIECLRQTI